MSKKPIIVFEGIEGSGKTFHIDNVSNYLKRKKIPYLKIREPGGSRNSEIIRKIILNKKSSFNKNTDLLLYLSARSENIELIKKNYKKKIVHPALRARFATAACPPRRGRRRRFRVRRTGARSPRSRDCARTATSTSCTDRCPTLDHGSHRPARVGAPCRPNWLWYRSSRCRDFPCRPRVPPELRRYRWSRDRGRSPAGAPDPPAAPTPAWSNGGRPPPPTRPQTRSSRHHPARR